MNEVHVFNTLLMLSVLYFVLMAGKLYGHLRAVEHGHASPRDNAKHWGGLIWSVLLVVAMVVGMKVWG